MEHFQAILISIKIVKDYIALLIISLLNKGNFRYIFRFELGKKMKIYRWEKFEICMYEFLIYSIRFYIVLFFFLSFLRKSWKCENLRFHKNWKFSFQVRQSILIKILKRLEHRFITTKKKILLSIKILSLPLSFSLLWTLLSFPFIHFETRNILVYRQISLYYNNWRD